MDVIETPAIVLQQIKYQEKSLIVKCLTEKDGIQSFFVKNAFSAKRHQANAYFQPLNLLNISYKPKKNEALKYFSQVQLAYHYHNIYLDYQKSIVWLFLAEFLQQIITESAEFEAMYAYLHHQFIRFDMEDFNPNFHITLLSKLSRYIGFLPENNYSAQHPYFNLKSGKFEQNFEVDCWNATESYLFHKAMLTDWNISNHLNGSERKEILQLLVKYYKYHWRSFPDLHSLQVVSELL